MRVKMWRKKDWGGVYFLTALTAVPVIYDLLDASGIPWHLLILWFSLSVLLIVPNQILSYARELEGGAIELKESIFSKAMLLYRRDVSRVELYEVDRQPIGLKIVCHDDKVITFAPSTVDFDLLEKVRDMIQKDKI